MKAIEDTALAMASVCRSLEFELPRAMPKVSEDVRRAFSDLVARIMPFDLVIDEETADGHEARVSKTSVCGSWGPIAGDIRYFADRFGVPRASIEGTQLPLPLIKRYASGGAATVVYDNSTKRDRLVLRRRLSYFGFELEREDEEVDVFPGGMEGEARRVLAEALASGEARHPAARRHRQVIEEVREIYRRSGGITPRLGQEELVLRYERALTSVRSMHEFRAAPLALELRSLVPDDVRERVRELPDAVEIRGKWIEVEYDVEPDSSPASGSSPADALIPVARLRLPEKIARTLTPAELPALDRPLRFVVTRGPRGAVRASSLGELQDLLDRPWSPEEMTVRPREREPRSRQRSPDGQAREPRRGSPRGRRHGTDRRGRRRR
jgi:hypothetical protein